MTISSTSTVSNFKVIRFKKCIKKFIKIKNELIAPGRISYKIRKGAKPKTNNFSKNSKSFFLVNKTIQKIKVYIPGVKNPIIDSNTRLFLNLKIGQSIFLRFGNEMRELIKINDSIKNNSQINLADLIDNAINRFARHFKKYYIRPTAPAKRDSFPLNLS